MLAQRQLSKEVLGNSVKNKNTATKTRTHLFSGKYTKMEGIGKKVWAIAEGYIPSQSHGQEPEMTSHETLCILNTSDQDAKVSITIYYTDRSPVGPYRVTVPAERTRHIRFNDLYEPEPIPEDIEYASVIISDVPILVQYTRLDSRQAENAIFSTIAYPVSG